MQIAELIELKVSEGKDILIELDEMRKARGAAINVNYYVNEDVEKCRKHINKWQMTSKDILISKFGETHRYVSSFEKTVSNKDKGFDYKKEFLYEVNRGLSVLESVRESLNLGLNTSVAVEKTEENKPKKIFISHSTADAEFAEALVNMLHAIGVQYNEIFCSSVPGCWVEEGQDFIQTIKKHFQDYELYMLYIHSPRFYNSHVCLNEMGAAWIAQSDYSSFLTSDMSYEQMDAVVRNTEIAIKVDTNDANFRLNDWLNRLLRWLNKPAVETNVWEYHRGIFLNTVKNIHYNQKKTSEEQLSEYDKERLKKWVDSGDNTLFQAWYAEGSATFGLGAKNQYTVKGGREIAEWVGFFKRLLSLGLVEFVGHKKGHPDYKLTEAAYIYFD